MSSIINSNALKCFSPKYHSTKLTLYCNKTFQSDTGTNYYKEIPLSEILAVETTAKKTASADGGQLHCFEIRTANVDYFVGEDAKDKQDMSSGVGSDLAKQWEVAIRQALMPVTQGAGATPTSKATGPRPGSQRCVDFVLVNEYFRQG